jgi:TPR repeat protein
LGDLFFEGRGVSKSEAEGARWYARAAAAGDPAAQYAYAMAHFYGRGVAPSDSVGLVWLERAAQRGHQGAVDELARRKPQD